MRRGQVWLCFFFPSLLSAFAGLIQLTGYSPSWRPAGRQQASQNGGLIRGQNALDAVVLAHVWWSLSR